MIEIEREREKEMDWYSVQHKHNSTNRNSIVVVSVTGINAAAAAAAATTTTNAIIGSNYTQWENIINSLDFTFLFYSRKRGAYACFEGYYDTEFGWFVMFVGCWCWLLVLSILAASKFESIFTYSAGMSYECGWVNGASEWTKRTNPTNECKGESEEGVSKSGAM